VETEPPSYVASFAFLIGVDKYNVDKFREKIDESKAAEKSVKAIAAMGNSGLLRY